MAAPRKKDKNTVPKAAELRALSLPDLEKKLSDEQETLMRDRFRHATAALEDTASLKTRRRLIARLATIINQKRREA